MRPRSIVVTLVGTALTFASAVAAPDPAAAKQLYAQRCAVCHGLDADGSDRGPALAGNRRLRTRSTADLAAIIRNGTPGGMPAFPLPEDELTPVAEYVHLLNATAFEAKPAG